jgi:hypothetical protein
MYQILYVLAAKMCSKEETTCSHNFARQMSMIEYPKELPVHGDGGLGEEEATSPTNSSEVP